MTDLQPLGKVNNVTVPKNTSKKIFGWQGYTYLSAKNYVEFQAILHLKEFTITFWLKLDNIKVTILQVNNGSYYDLALKISIENWHLRLVI